MILFWWHCQLIFTQNTKLACWRLMRIITLMLNIYKATEQTRTAWDYFDGIKSCLMHWPRYTPSAPCTETYTRSIQWRPGSRTSCVYMQCKTVLFCKRQYVFHSTATYKRILAIWLHWCGTTQWHCSSSKDGQTPANKAGSWLGLIVSPNEWNDDWAPPKVPC